jgi:hypothetical protein
MIKKQKIIKFINSHPGKKITFFINVNSRIDEIAYFLKDVALGRLIIYFNMEVPKQFLEAQLKVKTSEEYLTRQDYASIDNYIFDGISTSWYLYKDITKYRGIHLGSAFEYDFQKYLTPRIKNLEVMRKVIERENIEAAIAIDDTGELAQVAKSYGRSRGLAVIAVPLAHKRKSSFIFGSVFRSGLASWLMSAFDTLALRRILKMKGKENLILIDAKLLTAFCEQAGLAPFIPMPLEGGIGARIRILRKGFPYLPMSPAEKRKSRKDWILFPEIWRSISTDTEFRQIFNYKDIKIWDIVQDKLRNFFFQIAPRIITNINFLTSLLRDKKFKMVVLRNDVKELERTVIFTSRLIDMPSVVIQHGVMAEPNGHSALLADKFLAWGKASVDWYRKFGNSDDKFHITGNLHFDSLLNWRPCLTRRKICKKLNLDAHKSIILFASQQINKFSSFWTDDLFLVLTHKLLSALCRLKDTQLIIKADPYEDLEPYKKMISCDGYCKTICLKNFNIYTLIYICDLVITLDSTVGLEAMFFDKPLIAVNLTKREDRVPYAKNGAAIGVYRESDLIPAIKTALTDNEAIAQLKNKREKFIEDYAYALDGRAGERILSFIRNYAQN